MLRKARVLDAHEIKDFSLSKRITLILCLIYSAQVAARDSLIEMFLRKMRSVNNDAKKELELIKQRIQETQERLVGVLTNVLKVFVDEQGNVAGQKDSHPENYSSDISGADYIKQAQLLSLPVDNLTFPSSLLFDKLNDVFILDGGVDKLLQECEAMNAYKGNNYLPLIWKFYKNPRHTFFRLIKILDLKSTTNEQSIINALNFVLENSHRRGEFLPATIELDFISEQWRKLIVVKLGEKTKLVRRHLEVCVLGSPEQVRIEYRYLQKELF